MTGHYFLLQKKHEQNQHMKMQTGSSMSSYWQKRNVSLTIVLDEDQASLKEELHF